MKPIVVHSQAELELWCAVAYYEDKQRGLGLDFEEEIRHSLADIQEAPELWSKREGDIRFRLLSRFPYIIYYIELPDKIWVIAFAHTSRKPFYWRERFEVDRK